MARVGVFIAIGNVGLTVARAGETGFEVVDVVVAIVAALIAIGSAATALRDLGGRITWVFVAADPVVATCFAVTMQARVGIAEVAAVTVVAVAVAKLVMAPSKFARANTAVRVGGWIIAGNGAIAVAEAFVVCATLPGGFFEAVAMATGAPAALGAMAGLGMVFVVVTRPRPWRQPVPGSRRRALCAVMAWAVFIPTAGTPACVGLADERAIRVPTVMVPVHLAGPDGAMDPRISTHGRRRDV